MSKEEAQNNHAAEARKASDKHAAAIHKADDKAAAELHRAEDKAQVRPTPTPSLLGSSCSISRNRRQNTRSRTSSRTSTLLMLERQQTSTPLPSTKLTTKPLLSCTEQKTMPRCSPFFFCFCVAHPVGIGVKAQG